MTRVLPAAVVPAGIIGALALTVAATAGVVNAGLGPGAVLADVIVLAAAAAAVAILIRRPWLAPWSVILLFPLTAELQLRVSSLAGVSKDGVILLLAAIAIYHVQRSRENLTRLKPLAPPLAALGVLVLLYLINPGGGHDSGWAFGTRLLLEGVALLVIGMVGADPRRTVRHLVRAMCVIIAFEAVFAWIQQSAGLNSLVYTWGYQYGSQVRQTSGGGLRTSGTFNDPFQLMALAVLGFCLAAFVARRGEAVVLVAGSLAIFGATQVRTALIQLAVIALFYAVKRRWFVPTGSVLAALAAAGLFAGLTITTTDMPGGHSTPLLLGLNGRSTAWSQAITTERSFVFGHGVGAVGTGSNRGAEGLITKAAAYDKTKAPTAVFAGNSAFLDSSYAQVQSDTGIAGTAAMLIWIVGTLLRLRRPLNVARQPDPDTSGAPEPDDVGVRLRWAAGAVLSVSAIDWIGRSTLGSYTTGFLTLYVLGVLLGACCAPGVTVSENATTTRAFEPVAA